MIPLTFNQLYDILRSKICRDNTAVKIFNPVTNEHFNIIAVDTSYENNAGRLATQDSYDYLFYILPITPKAPDPVDEPIPVNANDQFDPFAD